MELLAIENKAKHALVLAPFTAPFPSAVPLS